MSVRRPAWRKAVVIIATIATLGTGAAVTTSTVAQNDIGSQWDHVVTCFDFMINNPARHRRNCQPNPNYPTLSKDTLALPVTGSPALLPAGS